MLRAAHLQAQRDHRIADRELVGDAGMRDIDHVGTRFADPRQQPGQLAGPIVLSTVVQTSRPPVTADVYGCSLQVPAYLVPGPHY